jgi:Mn2+/Fe2+ NRAMP family transporter
MNDTVWIQVMLSICNILSLLSWSSYSSYLVLLLRRPLASHDLVSILDPIWLYLFNLRSRTDLLLKVLVLVIGSCIVLEIVLSDPRQVLHEHCIVPSLELQLHLKSLVFFLKFLHLRGHSQHI